MDAPARRLPAEFRRLLAADRAFTTLALELIDGTVAPAVVVMVASLVVIVGAELYRRRAERALGALPDTAIA